MEIRGAEVWVRLTTDGWKHIVDNPATFAYSLPTADTFSFRVKVSHPSTCKSKKQCTARTLNSGSRQGLDMSAYWTLQCPPTFISPFTPDRSMWSKTSRTILTQFLDVGTMPAARGQRPHRVRHPLPPRVGRGGLGLQRRPQLCPHQALAHPGPSRTQSPPSAALAPSLTTTRGPVSGMGSRCFGTRTFGTSSETEKPFPLTV